LMPMAPMVMSALPVCIAGKLIIPMSEKR